MRRLQAYFTIFIILVFISCKDNQEKTNTISERLHEEESKLEIVDHSHVNEQRMQLVKHGDRLPHSELLNTKNQLIDLTSKKGHILILNFWASWCTPCVEYMPDYQKLSKESSGTNIEYISISIDDEMSYWKNFIKKRDWIDHSYWLGMKEKEPLFAFTYSEIVSAEINSVLVALPKYVIISSDGVIVNNNASHPDSDEFKEELNALKSSVY